MATARERWKAASAKRKEQTKAQDKSNSKPKSSNSSSVNKARESWLKDSAERKKQTEAQEAERVRKLESTSKSSKKRSSSVDTSRPSSVVFKRDGSTITKQTYQGGKVVGSEIVQTKDTPQSQRRTTSQLADQQRIMSRTQQLQEHQKRQTEVPVLSSSEKGTARQRYDVAQDRFQSGKKLTSADFFALQAGPERKEFAFGTTTQKKQVSSAIVAREKAIEDIKRKSEDAKFARAYSPMFKENIPTDSQKSKTFVEVLATSVPSLPNTFVKKQAPLEVRALTKEEKFAATPVVKQFGEFKSGFQSFLKEPSFRTGLKEDPSLTPSERLGGVAAGFFTAAAIGETFPTPAASKAAASLAFSSLARPILIPIAGSLLAQQGVVQTSKALLPSELKEFETNVRVQTAYKKALRTVRQSPGETGFIAGKVATGLMESLPVVTTLAAGKSFETEFRKELKITGFEDVRPGETDLAYRYARARLARSEGGELAGLLGAGALTETIGRATLSKTLAKFKAAPKALLKTDVKLIKEQARLAVKAAIKTPSGKLTSKFGAQKLASTADDFASLSGVMGATGRTAAPKFVPSKLSTSTLESIKTASVKATGGRLKSQARRFVLKKEVFKTIAPLGFAEGFAESVGSDIARDRKVDLKSAAITGLIAAPLAGAIGADIAGATTKRGAQIRSGIANVLDPSEKPGDLISSLSSKIMKTPSKVGERIRGAVVATPAFSVSPVLFTQTAIPSTPSVTAETPSITPDKPRVSVKTPSMVPSNVITKTKASGIPGEGGMVRTDPKLSVQPKTSPVSSQLSVTTSVPTSVSTSVPVATTVSTSTTTTSVPVATTVPTEVPTTVPVATTVPTTVPVIVPVIKEPSLKFGLGAKIKKVQGYDVFVREKGKLVKVNEKPLSHGDAVSRGGYVADNTPAATFKIKKVKGGAQPSKDPVSIFARNKFRGRIVKGKEVKRPNTFLEKNAFRIDSKGEREGITVRGLLAQEEKRKKARVLANLDPKFITGGQTLRLQAQKKFARNIKRAKLNTALGPAFDKKRGSKLRL